MKGKLRTYYIVRQIREKSSCLLFKIYNERSKKMVLRFALLIVCFVVLLFCLDYVLPKLIDRYKKYRELKNRKRREQAFKKKMEELEIK